jgi:hypothetical protein
MFQVFSHETPLSQDTSNTPTPALMQAYSKKLRFQALQRRIQCTDLKIWAQWHDSGIYVAYTRCDKWVQSTG